MSAIVAAAAGVVAAAIHGDIFVKESIQFTRPDTLAMFEVDPADATAVRLWAYHQGVYNLLLGLTALTGALALLAGATVAGGTLIVASAVFMIAAAVALVLADRRRSRIPAFVAQAVPPLFALVALALG